MLPGKTDTNDYINYILKKDGDGNNRLLYLASKLSNKSSQENQGSYIFKYKFAAQIPQ